MTFVRLFGARAGKPMPPPPIHPQASLTLLADFFLGRYVILYAALTILTLHVVSFDGGRRRRLSRPPSYHFGHPIAPLLLLRGAGRGRSGRNDGGGEEEEGEGECGTPEERGEDGGGRATRSEDSTAGSRTTTTEAKTTETEAAESPAVLFQLCAARGSGRFSALGYARLSLPPPGRAATILAYPCGGRSRPTAARARRGVARTTITLAARPASCGP